MPRFSLKTGRTSKSNWFPDTQQQHPAPSPTPRPQNTLSRSTSVSDRFSSGYAGDRRSIAVIPSGEQSFTFDTPDDIGQPSPVLSGGLSRSQTVLRREGTRSTRNTNLEPHESHSALPSPVWSPDLSQLPPPGEQNEAHESRDANVDEHNDDALMSGGQHYAGKVSSDSGSNTALDRWSQRRLQRLNTEQGFREQRSGGQVLASPPASGEPSNYIATGVPYPGQEAQPQATLHQHSQPHPAQQTSYQIPQTQAPHPNAGLAIQTQSTNYPPQQYSPSEPALQSSGQESAKAPSASNRAQPQSQLQQQQQQPPPPEDVSMSSSNNGSLPAPRPVKSASNRQSMNNGLSARNGSNQQQGVAAFNASVVPAGGQGQVYKNNGQSQQQPDVGRVTPQPVQTGEDMTEEDINQLIKDHKELREKYTKVKKYYFEKEDQVKQLQNSLAHQRLSQSRTSLDDSEYTTRFNRLDGLIAQLAFSIRKSWRSVPDWLSKSANRDAVATGKQEMTAVGRAIISRWLVEEAFDKYFHPDLDPTLSAQLKAIQHNIRRFAPAAQSVEEEEYLTSKVVNWRLATLEGLQEALRSPQCPANRAQLTETLKAELIAALSVHLQEPPPADLEGGVHMIIELVVSIAIHLPLESRDVAIDYFKPGYSIMNEQMKLESGIPPLTISVHDEQSERASLKSASSEITDATDASANPEGQTKKRGMLSALTGKSKSTAAQGKQAGAGGSSSSLNRPDSSQGMKEDAPPRVRMAAGIGVSIRGRSVLVKAPVFST